MGCLSSSAFFSAAAMMRRASARAMLMLGNLLWVLRFAYRIGCLICG
jgi:hypothetical protein